jgi:hypothetical protein
LLVREEIFLFLWVIEFLVEFGVVMLRDHNQFSVRAREIVKHHGIASTRRRESERGRVSPLRFLSP